MDTTVQEKAIRFPTDARLYDRSRERLVKAAKERGIRDIDRRCFEPDEEMRTLLAISKKIHRQKRKDKNKVYSVHAPEVACISK